MVYYQHIELLRQDALAAYYCDRTWPMQNKITAFFRSPRFLSYINRRRHIVYVAYIALYLPIFYLEEKLNRVGYFVSYLPLDDKIPFCEWFAIPYYLWEPYLFFTGFFLFYLHRERFKDYMRFLGWSFFTVVILYALFPNGQNLRPTSFAHDNFCVDIVKWTYARDTNTNVNPSLHVLGTMSAMFALWRVRSPKHMGWQVLSITVAAFICASTVFIKQHSIFDVITGVGLSILFYFIIYRWRPARLAAKAEKSLLAEATK